MESVDKLGPETFPIVCLCGSAGGLQAYRTILRDLPVNTGMAFVLVSHRGTDSPHLLRRLLSKMTDMVVIEGSDGMRLEPNLLILAPPHVKITTDGIILTILPLAKRDGDPTVITTFLRSMAATCASRSVAVILSGMGRDGSAALGAIKKSGGATYAQSDGEFESMPQEAIDTGHVDFILTAEAIGEHLAKDSQRKSATNN